jgi:hypothetical protein
MIALGSLKDFANTHPARTALSFLVVACRLRSNASGRSMAS